MERAATGQNGSLPIGEMRHQWYFRSLSGMACSCAGACLPTAARGCAAGDRQSDLGGLARQEVSVREGGEPLDSDRCAGAAQPAACGAPGHNGLSKGESVGRA